MRTSNFDNGPQVLGAAPLALVALWFAVEDQNPMAAAQRLSPWRWAELALPGAVTEAQEAYKTAMVGAIDAGELAPKQRRYTHPGGPLDADKTLLNLDDLANWRLACGLRHSPTLIAVQNEERLAHLAAMDAIKATRNRATLDTMGRIKTANLAASMGIEEIAGLLREVEHLKAKQATDADTISELKRELRARPEPETPKTSALLVIGRVLEIHRSEEIPRSEEGKPTQDALSLKIQEGESLRGLSPRNISDLFSEANKALVEARKAR